MPNTATHAKLVAFSLPAAAAGAVAGALVDPGVDESTSTTYMQGLAQGNAADRYQVSAMILHVAFLLLVPAVIGLWGLSRPGVPRTIGLVLGIMGAATLPGLVTSDYYDIALATHLPAAQAADIADDTIGLTGAALLIKPAVIGLGLGLITLMVSAVRAGSIPVWVPAAIVAAFALPAFSSSLAIPAGACLAAAFVALSYRLLRDRETAPAPALA